MRSIVFDAALRYAELGYSVFPCAPGEKLPATAHGFKDASTDPVQIERWWTEKPASNIGIPTQGLLVLDIDVEAQWLQDQPERLSELAGAPLSLTPSGGRRYVFRQPAGRAWRNTQGEIAPHVDTRANGGLFVAPPSALPGGKAYRWVDGCELDIPPDKLPEPPGWLTEILDRIDGSAHGGPTQTDRPWRPSAPRDAASAALANVIPSGQRNGTLAKLAGTMRRVGMTLGEIQAALLKANADRCRPPLDPREVYRIAESIGRYEPDQISVALVENHWEQMLGQPADGSAGHSGLWGLNIDEGTRQDHGGRRWEVEVISASEAFAQRVDVAHEQSEERKQRQQQSRDEKHREALLKALRLYPDGETPRVIRETAALSGAVATRQLSRLMAEGLVEECLVRKHTREERGVRLCRHGPHAGADQGVPHRRQPDGVAGGVELRPAADRAGRVAGNGLRPRPAGVRPGRAGQAARRLVRQHGPRAVLPGRAFYIWGGYANCGNYPPFLKKHGLYFSQAVIWVKEHPVLTRKDFMGNHEWCFYGWREGAAHQFFGPNNATDVWSVKKVNPQSMVHLTEKPVELAVRAMQYSSRAGENVLDPFGGSGSTLIAAEQTGRKAFLMELDPLYCDVICERWCKFTGQEAVCVDSQGTQTTRSERVARAQEPAT